MSISIQTNVASLNAQYYISQNQAFQNTAIQQLSSGYKINSSADDPAGLAVANQYAGEITQLTAGVQNATDGVSTLQIADGGLSNISQILGRLQTLASESASGTFQGNRTTVNNEYQGLLAEINRQAANIGLNTGGVNNTNLTVYTGGGSSQTNSQVTVNLSGANNAVDSTALGIANSSAQAGSTGISSNTVNLSNTASLLTGTSQNFTFLCEHWQRQYRRDRFGRGRQQRTERHAGDQQPQQPVAGLWDHGIHRKRRHAAVRRRDGIQRDHDCRRHRTHLRHRDRCQHRELQH